MPAWTPPTLADELGENPPARCACGREVPADMLVDVRALPDAVRKVARGGRPREDVEAASHLCDGCRERAVREGRITREEVVRRLGAPAWVVDKMRGRGGAQ